MITAICITYGRQHFLERTLACFLSQEHPTTEQIELLILNTCPRQRFKGEFPFTRIINLKHRPESLGLARNMAIADAQGDRIVTVDDDDVYLPHFLRTFSEAWGKDDEWIWLDKRLCAYGDSINEISYGCHGGCFGFTKHAWETCGGYPHLTVGEDRVLVQKITKLAGKRVLLGDSTPPFICCWGNGCFHVSGQGNDKAGTPSAHLRAEAALVRRFATGEEKSGEILLKPHCSVDWKEKAGVFMSAQLKKNSMNDEVCVVELGRFGDIVNILPILLHIHNTYRTPYLMVSREFASVLDGVSYVKPHIVDLRNDQLEKALKLARSQFKHVLCAQIWGGPTYAQERLCQSFNMESWRMCGFLHKFNDLDWRPVFDLRDRESEAGLVAKLSTDKPMLLVNVTHSVSSPFPGGALLYTAIKDSLGKDFNIVNIGGMKLHRIYDLLGLMDAAACLVSIDSAALHLAAASNVPTVALTNNDPWLGTLMRSGFYHRMTYEWASKRPDQVLQMVVRYALGGKGPMNNHWFIRESPSPALSCDLFHCYERHRELNRAEENRKGVAQRSWLPLYRDQGVHACILDEQDYPRSSFDIGDHRKLPYLKDVLALGLEDATRPEDIIFFTNDDNWLHPELVDMLRYHVSIYECCTSRRCEFKNNPMPPATRPPREFAQASHAHMGRDLIAFTKRWLDAHWDEIPDFILGASDWDLCLACLIRDYFGIHSTRKNLEIGIHPAELPLGYVSHQHHAPAWNRPAYVNCAPSQVHNRTLFRDWAKDHAPQLVFDANLCI